MAAEDESPESTTKDSQWLMRECLGDIGYYQVMVAGIVFFSNYAVPPQQVIAVLHSPKELDFTCSNSSMEQCDSDCPSHVFPYEVFEETIVTEWDLVCKYSYVPEMVASIILSGILIGSFVFGFFSDRFGRKPTVGVAIFLQIVGTAIVAVANSIWVYGGMRWLSAFATAGVVLVHYCIFIEFTSIKYRPILAYLYFVPAHVGYSSMGVIAYFVRHWRYNQLAVLLWPALLLMICWFLLPEAPLRLLTLGETDKVVTILERGAKYNGLPQGHIRAKVEEYLKANPPESHNKGGHVNDLFRTKRMQTKTLVLWVDWFVIGVSYFAIAQYMGKISGNIFLNLACGGVVAQTPAVLMGMILVQKIGRRFVLTLGYTLGFVPMAISTILPRDPHWPIAFFGCIGQAGAALSFTTAYMFTCELFPTLLRNVGLGTSSVFCRGGAMLSPLIVDLKYTAEWMPPMILFIGPFVAALLTWLLLPETKGMLLSNTVEEADKI